MDKSAAVFLIAFLLLSTSLPRPVAARVKLDPKDPEAVASAKFAVDYHNNDKHTNIQFIKLTEAYMVPERKGFRTYELIFDAKENPKATDVHPYRAHVVALLNCKSLIDFKKKN